MEKINIAELLKDCPQGMELDCTMYDDVTFNRLQGNEYIIINRGYNGGEVHLTKFGQMFNSNDAKCVIFPKGKTTWEGFVPPVEFKNGDILVNGDCIFIYDGFEDNLSYGVYAIESNGVFSINILTKKYGTRFASKEEKQKLFDAIKINGYRWNPETKILEKLIVPKFKVGDRVRNKNYKDYIYDIHDITDKGYRAKEVNADSPIIILFGSQEDNYELVPNKFDISTLKPFNKVLVRNEKHHVWFNSFFGVYKKDSNAPFVCCNGFEYKYCIPYEGNQHLLGTANDCDDFYKTWEK